VSQPLVIAAVRVASHSYCVVMHIQFKGVIGGQWHELIIPMKTRLSRMKLPALTQKMPKSQFDAGDRDEVLEDYDSEQDELIDYDAETTVWRCT
jgi:hypothetical protein